MRFAFNREPTKFNYFPVNAISDILLGGALLDAISHSSILKVRQAVVSGTAPGNDRCNLHFRLCVSDTNQHFDAPKKERARFPAPCRPSMAVPHKISQQPNR